MEKIYLQSLLYDTECLLEKSLRIQKLRNSESIKFAIESLQKRKEELEKQLDVEEALEKDADILY